MFNPSDINQLKEKGISPQEAEDQLTKISQGSFSLEILRPALINDGISLLSGVEKKEAVALWQKEGKSFITEKFVPASGAASRMFKDLYTFLETGNESSEVQKFFNGLQDFPFYRVQRNAFQARGWTAPWTYEKKKTLIRYLLNQNGLNWGSLPKGLLPFHQFGDRVRTPVGEHLDESRYYGADETGKVNIHFTISPETKNLFHNNVLEEESQFPDSNYEITYSFQDPSTETLCLNEEGDPFRLHGGDLLFRPGGHGSLLKNLNERDRDLFFIKNIDNVQQESFQQTTRQSFQELAGYLLQVRKKLQEMKEQWTKGKLPEKGEILRDLKVYCGRDYSSFDDIITQKEKILNLLNSPIRICGMVKNQGEPGGGPFWVKESDGTSSLQIVESAQIDLEDEGNQEIMSHSTHFNPVFLVCLKLDLSGKRIDLNPFVQEEACFVTEKNLNGKKLKALEHPGLWNGSMSRWITHFLEIPLECFTPVKTICDLLRKEHR